MEARKTVGVLGGMGPEATADFFWRIIRLTPARRDQDHLRILVDNNPHIPDRTKALVEGGESPAPALVETARNLERAGADFIAMPCNSAHAWYEEIARAVRIPVLNMIEIAARAARQAAGSPAHPVLLLATTGTVRTGLYQKALERVGLTVRVPGEAEQEQVMEAIYLVKGGQNARARTLALEVASRELAREQAGVVVLGCTELPLVLKPGDFEIPVVDSTEELALATVRYAFGNAEPGGRGPLNAGPG